MAGRKMRARRVGEPKRFQRFFPSPATIFIRWALSVRAAGDSLRQAENFKRAHFRVQAFRATSARFLLWKKVS